MMDSDDDSAEGEAIGPAGIQKMCEEIDVQIDDICLLIMAWHLGATRVGYFSKEEWMKLSNFGITNLETLRIKVPQFQKDIQNIDNAKRLFLFTFNYIRETAETKVIPVEIAEAYIRLILPNSVHTDPFCSFLMKQKDEPKGYRAINLDQWKMWFEFSHTMPGDLSTYDEEAAWPLIIDNYVIQRRAFLSSNGMQTSSS
jgi:DCN1-like protein 4/5